MNATPKAIAAHVQARDILLPDEFAADHNFSATEDGDSLTLTPRQRVVTRRHGRFDISFPLGRMEARRFLETCTDPEASIYFVCRGVSIRDAMEEILRPRPDPFGQPSASALAVDGDPKRWHRIIGLALMLLGSLAVWTAILALCGVVRL